MKLTFCRFQIIFCRSQSRTNDFVFPVTGKNGYLIETRRQLEKIVETSGIQFMIHDLHRTFITTAESLDISSYAVKRLANHKMSSDVTANYIIPNVERLRKPMQQITDEFLKYFNKKLCPLPNTNTTDDSHSIKNILFKYLT